jgi:hypothetical protein
MKRVNIILCFVIILASAACISLPRLNLPSIQSQPTTAQPIIISPTAEILLPTEIPTTTEPTATPLPPTEISTDIPEPTAIPDLPTATNTPTPQPFYPVRVDPPSYLPNFTHAEQGCRWIGVGGQIFDLDGQPVQGWTVIVTGIIDGEVRQWLGLSGLNTAFGPAGYEIELGDTPKETRGVFTIQLRDAAGLPLSEVVTFDTFDNCQANLIMINFVQSKAISKLYVPLITK